MFPEITGIYGGIYSAIGPKLMEIAMANPIDAAMYIFWHGLWVIFLAFFCRAIYEIWLDGRQGIYANKRKYTLLAIDIPKENEQTPRAVENIFATIAGAHVNFNLLDQKWVGKSLDSFSFELVTLGGYVQFLIRTETKYRDLIEASIYAQYPEAEITEVEDYVKDYAHLKFPNPEYDLWGSEFVYVKDYPYPIRTYHDFEFGPNAELKDPMASLLEVMSRFVEGEQGWLQLIVTPQAASWGEKAKKVMASLLGKPYAAPTSALENLFAVPGNAMEGAASSLFSIFTGPTEAKKEEAKDIGKLTPGEREVLEKVQNKLAKSVFAFKWRYVYLGKKEVFNKTRGVTGVCGAIKQFNTGNLNALKPGGGISKTAADYFRVPQRVAQKQNRIFQLYLGRSNYYGEDVGNLFMSEEELATIWHFPVNTVKASQVERIESKKSAPPTRLPYQKIGYESRNPMPVTQPSVQPAEAVRDSFNEPRPPSMSKYLLEEESAANMVQPVAIESRPSQAALEETSLPVQEMPVQIIPPNMPRQPAMPAHEPVQETQKAGLPSIDQVSQEAPERKKSAPPPNLPIV